MGWAFLVPPNYGVNMKFKAYRQESLTHGTGKHWNDPTSDSGYHRLTLSVDSLDEHGHAHSVPVHVLAQGKTQSGLLVYDNGSPFTVYDEVKTPDVLFYNLPPEVASLDVQGIRMGQDGERLVFRAEVDGEPYPGVKSWSDESVPRVGGMRSMLAHIMIDLLAWFGKKS